LAHGASDRRKGREVVRRDERCRRAACARIVEERVSAADCDEEIAGRDASRVDLDSRYLDRVAL
jgi:hypothetical protein